MRIGKVSRIYQGKTGVGCDGLHPKVPLDLTKETRVEVLEPLKSVEQSGRWPQQACTTMFFLIPKNISSERPIALMPMLVRMWEAKDFSFPRKILRVLCGYFEHQRRVQFE